MTRGIIYDILVIPVIHKKYRRNKMDKISSLFQNTNNKKLSLNAAFKKIFGEALGSFGFHVVKGKYLFVCFVEISSFILMTISVIIRMTVLADAPAYRSNALMNANLFALGSALVIFALFNSIFVGGFFKTAYKFAKPFLSFIIPV